MAEINLVDLSLNELKKLQKDVEKAITGFADKKRDAALAAAEAAAKEMGFTLAELGSAKKGKTARSTIPAKYQDPENPSLTWSGRGRKPGWIKQVEEAGRSLVDYLIGI